MANQIQKFYETEILGKTFAVYGTKENPLFLAKDVAEWLDYNKGSSGKYNVSAMLRVVDDEEKEVIIDHTPGGTQRMAALTENGLYEVLMQSRKPIAKSFKREVKRVLKELRLHGVTASADKIEEFLDDPDAFIAVLQKIKEERAARIAAEKIVEEQKSKAMFADAVASSPSSILVGELAKLLRQNGVKVGERRLFEKLREDGYLMKRGESRNLPTQVAVEAGLIEIQETTARDANGDAMLVLTPKITGKGQLYFVKRYLGRKDELEETSKVKSLFWKKEHCLL